MNHVSEKASIIAVTALPLLIGSGLTLLVFDTSLLGNMVAHVPQPKNPLELLTTSLAFTGLAILVVFLMYYVLEHRSMHARRALTAAVAAPVFLFSSVFLGQTILLVLFKGANQLNLLVYGLISFGSIGFSMFSLVLIVADVAPRYLKNMFVIIYGGSYGTFLGMVVPTYTMLVIIPAIILEDWFLTSYVLAKKKPEDWTSDPFKHTQVEMSSATIGFGDFIVYALLVAHALSYFPIFVWICSFILAITGMTVNVYILAKQERILPAIPLPAILAVFPWLVHIVTLTFIV
jgi:hypothetical protein